MDDLLINHRRVRRFHRAQFGAWSIREDHDRIVARLNKMRDGRKLALKQEFFGPTGVIPHGRLAFLYVEEPARYRSHEECIEAFRVADNWNSSDDGQSETSPEEHDLYQSPENTMRLMYGNRDPINLQRSHSADDSSSASSESGEYTREYQRRYAENSHLRRAMGDRPGSDLDRNVPTFSRPVSDMDSRFDDMSSSSSLTDLEARSMNGLDNAGTNPVTPPSRYRVRWASDIDAHQAGGTIIQPEGERAVGLARARSLIADIPASRARQGHTYPEHAREPLRGHLERLDTENDIQQLSVSSTQNFLGQTDRPVINAAVGSRPGIGSSRQSRFHENFSEASGPGTNEDAPSVSEVASSNTENSASRQRGNGEYWGTAVVGFDSNLHFFEHP
ncbi:MAG: hypothetical protein Q9209_003616 [Squamulea sp. 1 TL-2023]